MQRYLVWCGVALLAVSPVRAQEAPVSKRVLDLWEATYLDGAKMGYQHTTVDRLERDGQKVYRTTKFLHLTLKRYNSVVKQQFATTTEETADGQVVGLSMTHYLPQGRQMIQSGRVQGDSLIVRTPTDPEGKPVPWKAGVIGQYGQEVLFQVHKVKPGDRFRFLDYQLPLLTAVPIQVVVKNREEKDVLVVKQEGEETKGAFSKQELLRAEMTPDKVRIGENEMRLPRLIVWLDDKLQVVRQESDVPGLGRMTSYRTTRELAEKEGVAPALLADLGLKTLVPLDRRIPNAHEAGEVVYRITVKDDDDPGTLFTRDARQKIENIKDNTFELRVQAIRGPREVENPADAKEEFLKSSYFLDSDDDKIRDRARRLTGDTADPWEKARRLEKWVHEHMRENTEVNFTPASQILQDLQGDCRQNAMLLATLCRAAGVPARTAVGLVYVNDPQRGPLLGFHMWTEVWVKGQWLMLDAVFGQGSVGAEHLKVADNSWQDIQTLAPLLPIARIAGKIRVEVVAVK
jgi:hypothetical protein